MAVPFIDLKRFEEDFHDRLIDKYRSMTLGAQFIGGAEVTSLEADLAPLMGGSHVVGCANGTDALQLALRAVGVREGDIVLVPNVTFWATFEAVVNVGGKPVTVDADIRDGGVSLDAFADALRKEKPKAALIAHLYGWGSAHLGELRTLCKEAGVTLIEDGAQSFGALYNGKPICAGADISTTSFYPAKVLGAAGDGGAVCTDDEGLAQKVRQLGNHGRTTHYGYGAVGWNSRLDSLQAAFLNLSLEFIDQRIASRRASAAFYAAHLPKTGISTMTVPTEYTENGYCNVCLVENPDHKIFIEARLKTEGIGFGNIYPSVMSDQPGAEDYLAGHYGGNVGKILCASVLNLPLFPYMTTDELQAVVNVVDACNGELNGK